MLVNGKIMRGINSFLLFTSVFEKMTTFDMSQWK
jgi:hypothetical protein